MRDRRYAPVEPSQVYSLLAWVLNLFVGAALNVVVLTFLVFVLQALPWPAVLGQVANWIALVLLAVAFVLLPIILSSLTTELAPTRIIVPPSYIQVLSAGWFLVIFPIWNLVPNWFFSLGDGLGLLFVLLAILGAAVDDALTPSALGYAFDPKKLPVRCLVVQASVSEVQDCIMNDDYRSIIGLQKDPVEIEQGLLLRTPKSDSDQVLMLLSKAGNETRIIISAFVKEQYQITAPDVAKELLREKTLYITEILTFPKEGTKPIPVTEEKDESRLVKDRELIAAFILKDEAIGFFEKLSKVSTSAWARIVLIAITYGVSLWFYLNGNLNYAAETFAITTATIAVLTGIQVFKRKTAQPLSAKVS
jgi:hypothetical protein